MSQRRTLEYIFTGNTRGFEAAQNRIFAGLGRLSSQSRKSAGDLGLIDQQLKAIGTTARYALAGSLVFGITGAIQRLQDFQNQLGVVAGLAGTVNARSGAYSGPGGGFLSNVGNEAQLAANRVGIATEDVQNYMSRFFSTFQYTNSDHKRALTDMRAFVGEVTRLQALMGAEAGDPQQLAGGIAGLVNQIPGGRRNVAKTTNRVANLVTELTAATPNITGRDISRDIGRIGATMNQTGMTPEQVFAIWAQAGKAGGSASVIGRGVAQMMGGLLHPTTPAQQRAYQAIGLPTDPNQLRRMGAFNVFRRMANAATTGPISARNAASLNDENIDDPGSAISAAGVKGIDLNRVYGLFGRQESARQFVNILSQNGVRGLNNFVHTLKQAEDANRAYAREREAINNRSLARFTTARQNISLSLARGVAWPLDHLVAPPVIAASNLLAGHSNLRTGVDVAMGALLARSGIKRFLRARSLRGGGQATVGAALGAEAAPHLLEGGMATGSRDNPLWVIIHPTSWVLGQPGGDPHKNPKSMNEFKAIAKKVAGPASGFGAAAAGVDLALAAAPFTLGAGGAAGEAYWMTHGQRYSGAGIDSRLSGAQKMGAVAADRFAMAMGFNASRVIQVQGEANANMTIKLVDAHGRTVSITEHNGVPVKMWGATNMPTARGKPGKRKGR